MKKVEERAASSDDPFFAKCWNTGRWFGWDVTVIDCFRPSQRIRDKLEGWYELRPSLARRAKDLAVPWEL
jgi:hypothetical protein